MCPGIHNSCCLKEDQLRMYSNWVHSKERNKIKKHYLYVNNLYINVMEEFHKVHDMAQKTIKVLDYKKIANCKVLANRIIAFEVTQLFSRIQENLRRMEDFLYDSYKGFYCSICDHGNHQFFNKKTRTIQFSEKFCRDVVENSLSNLLFFHIDIVKYSNLVSKFLLSCD